MHDYFIKRTYLGTPCTFPGIFGNPCTICDSRMRVTSHKQWFSSTESIFGIKTWARDVEVRWEVDRWVWRPLTCRCFHPELLRVLKQWKESHVSGKTAQVSNCAVNCLAFILDTVCNVTELSPTVRICTSDSILLPQYYLFLFPKVSALSISKVYSTKPLFSSQAILVKNLC